MKRHFVYILCSIGIIATNINGNSVRLSGMGNLRYVVEDYNNEFNFFDFAQIPADLIEDDSGRTVLRGNCAYTIGSFDNYNGNFSGFYRKKKTCIGSELGYKNYYSSTLQSSFGNIFLSHDLGPFRNGLTVEGDQWSWEYEDILEKIEDNIGVGFGVSSVPFTFEKNSSLRIGATAGYQKERFFHVEGEGVVKNFGTQLLYTLPPVANLIISVNTVSYKREYQGDTIRTYKSSSQNGGIRYKYNINSKNIQYNFDLAGNLYLDSQSRSISVTFGTGCRTISGTICGAEFTNSRTDWNYMGDSAYSLSRNLNFGIEHPLAKKIFVRGGIEDNFYELTDLVNPSKYCVGLGYLSSNIRIDIAYNYLRRAIYGATSDHTFSLLLIIFL